MSYCCQLNGTADLNGPNTKTLNVKPLTGELERDDVLSHFSAFGDVRGTTFLNMNDDCIHGILSVEFLSALDLCSVAETHPRLKQIAGRIFRRKHAKCDLDSLADGETKPSKRILRNFGPLVRSLEGEKMEFKNFGNKNVRPST